MNYWINRLKESSLKKFNDLARMFENWKKEIINNYIKKVICHIKKEIYQLNFGRE